MVRPLKKSIGPEYVEAEKRVMVCVLDKLIGVDPDWPDGTIELVKRADEVALATEKRDLVKPGVGTWKINAAPHPEKITFNNTFSPAGAERLFLRRYQQLKGLIDAPTSV